MKTSTWAFLLAASILSTSCGKSGGGNGGIREAEVAVGPVTPGGSQALEGNYEALLRPLNTQVSGFIPSGKAKISVKGETFSATTFLEDDSKVLHLQSIHEGTRCPDASDDVNGDGLVDAVEMKRATGNILIPLDGDLQTQVQGQGSYPMGTSFTYNKSAHVGDMFRDLYDRDLPADEFTKLSPGSPLNLEGRVVIIHGTSDLSRVPETVATVFGHPRNVSIPITCGVIRRR